jgi:hypothetical protein
MIRRFALLAAVAALAATAPALAQDATNAMPSDPAAPVSPAVPPATPIAPPSAAPVFTPEDSVTIPAPTPAQPPTVRQLRRTTSEVAPNPRAAWLARLRARLARMTPEQREAAIERINERRVARGLPALALQ